MALRNKCFKSLESYSNAIGAFHHDRAKEIADKERETIKSSSSRWSQCFALLAQLAIAEKNSQNLAFLLPKAFLRKDNSCKNQYDTLQDQFANLENVADAQHDSDLLETCAFELRIYVLTRNKLIAFYETAYLMASKSKVMNYEILLEQINQIAKTLTTDVNLQCLSGLKQSIQRECDILSGLMEAFVDMYLWRYTSSFTQLMQVSDCLKEWEEQLQQLRESRKISFMSSSIFGSVSDPLLYQWFLKLKNAALSNFVLIFDETLNKHSTNDNQHKVNRSKLHVDFVSKIQAFQKRYEDSRIAIVMNASELRLQDDEPDFGFHLDDETVPEACEGLKQYPQVFSHPEPLSRTCLPSVIMMLQQLQKDLESYSKVVSFTNDNTRLTYFMHKIHPRLILIMAAPKKFEMDPGIPAFIKEIFNQISCHNIFASLKPGTK